MRAAALPPPSAAAAPFHAQLDGARAPLFMLDESLAHMPCKQPWNPVLHPGRNVLSLWPHEWDTHSDNNTWAGAIKYNSVLGPRFKPLEDTGYHAFTLGFAFNSLFDFIPSRSDGSILYFDCEKGLHAEAKLRNFSAALTFIKHYPTCTQMDKVLGISDKLFYQQVMPTIFSMAEHINFLDPQIRFWEYNHCEHFHERVTSMCDGYPVVVSCSSRNRFVQRLLKSGKCVPRHSSLVGLAAQAAHTTTMSCLLPVCIRRYTEYVVKGEMVNTLCGFPFEHTGGHIAIRHDSRIHMENERRRAMIQPWEYWLGDKAYVGCPEFLTEFKKSKKAPLTAEKIEWNLLLQHYRGRNEHLVRVIKGGRKTLCTKWTGSYASICAIMKVTAHLVGLQERMLGPRYDCYGPWPMCPADIMG